LRITELCESWWDRLADASRAQQQHYAEQLLRLLGWQQPVPFSPKEQAQHHNAVPYLLHAGGQSSVACYFVLPGTLEPPAAITAHGLDFCPATRALTEEAASLSVQHVFISDFYRSWLYDVRNDELLLHASDPRSFNDAFVPVLRKDKMERGSLDELRRPPRTELARALREWTQRWTDRIMRSTTLAEESAALAIDRLIVLRYALQHNVLRRTRWRHEQRFRQITDRAAAGARGVGADLNRLFHDLWFDWRTDIYAPAPDLDRALEDDALAGPLLQECALHGRCKFHIATILESFNHGEPAEKLRVRMVPDYNEERELYLAKQTLATVDRARIEIDLMEEGYRAIFHWFDKMLALYERLQVDFESRARLVLPQAEAQDLFTWSEQDAQRPEACSDRFSHACERGFGIYYNGPRQLRIARLLLTLHLISCYDRSGHAANALPSLQHVLMRRPKVLAAHQIMRPTYDEAPAAEFYEG
jgi:hypothetical protein